jgi:hypothetical protein
VEKAAKTKERPRDIVANENAYQAFEAMKQQMGTYPASGNLIYTSTLASPSQSYSGIAALNR